MVLAAEVVEVEQHRITITFLLAVAALACSGREQTDLVVLTVR
jgi:hypothetical protein